MHHRVFLFVPRTLNKTTFRSIQTITDVRKTLQNLVGAQLVFGHGNQSGSHAGLTDNITVNSTLTPRTIAESYDEAIIPFATNIKLRERYVNFDNKVRFGRILEDLDTMAVHIAYKHNAPQIIQSINVHPLAIVTAAVDRIEVAVPHMDIDRDVRLSGFTSFVGKSSMEVILTIDQDNNGTWEHVLRAYFVLAARDPRTKKSAKMNPLIGSTEEDKEIIRKGELNRQRRLTEQDKSLFKTPPDTSESSIIHDLFIKTVTPNTSIFRSRLLNQDSMWMSETTLKTMHIGHPEQRNLYNKIFGGYLMRKSFDLAWTTASLFAKQKLSTLAVDDIMFQRPVEIGSLLFLSSMVVYVEGNKIQTRIHAEVVDIHTAKRETTNVFYFIFKTKDNSQISKNVVPQTYAEAMMYLDGKRHLD
ncbi:unnamed protein product [Adineta steineri]|uniref:HotDog ACOT-type domain-containing protein n=1 Tax=Adineta steineri TaxID=433720 RepID=A0A818X0T6_9BILA|nr:unnamed protein product [Adineta steineri]